MWSEATSALHEAVWRDQIDAEIASRARTTLAQLPVERDEPAGLRDEAWRLADLLGLAKTYDCEYLALASLHKCRFVTADARLHRAANRLGFVVDPVALEGMPDGSK